jgi:serine/threonine protein kinase
VGAPSPSEGTTSNRYAILGRIATGGMAEIFLARAMSLAGVERHVVLKRVLPERARDPVFVKMFLDEARLAAQLQHPNIAQVHDIGRLGDSYFFTMEYVHGEDLRAVLQRLAALRRLPPVQHALLIAAGAAAALHHAHERAGPDRRPLGIVHRDVSPSNVMVSFEGAVKLVDFGVAKASQRSTETRTGMVKGKIAYLSPEQCKGGAIDRRSDIFSLGVVLYELLTCTRLFKRETDFATMTAIVGEPAPPPSRVRPELTPEIDAVVLTALERDPERRFGSAGEMLEAIEAAAEAAGKSMSAHALGRFLRELFGERPEPWMELEVSDDAPSLVTVTSQSVIDADALAGAPSLRGRASPTSPPPIAGLAGLAGPPGPFDDLEQELRRTAHIRKREEGSESGSSMPDVAPLGAAQWSGAIPMQPAPGAARTLVASSPPAPTARPASIPPPVPGALGGGVVTAIAPDAPTTVYERGEPSSPHVPTGAPAPQSSSGSAPSGPVPVPVPLASPMSGPVPGSGPMSRSGSTSSPPIAMSGPGPMSGSMPALSPPPPSPFGTALPTTYPTYPGGGKPTVVDAENQSLLPARRWGVIALVAVVVIGVGIAIGAIATRDPEPIAARTSTAPAPTPSLPPVTAPSAPAVEPPAPAPVITVDAAVAAVPVATPDAAPVAPPEPPRDTTADALAAISAAASTGDWAAVWKTCNQLKRKQLTLDARAACAQAACVRKHGSEAIDLARGLPKARRASIAKVCSARGVDLDRSSGPDPCEANPLSCQH